ncbi:hypothetical protein GE061_010248 [Apolygus lucorum]|uniref:Uncharacterized protein n=1 Tax=Apolygus lucorum TaxID=248454 RepID=A0A6A4K6J5_APOLU|nr:hypothetical protein GE061_010248 [Apolygus lucorum]
MTPKSTSVQVPVTTICPNGNVSRESGGEIIKGENLETSKSTLSPKPTCPTSPSTKKCTGTREICRFTLPATPTYRKFMIGIHRERADACATESCCHPGGGRPKHPDEFQETGVPKDSTYRSALTGELAEKIVDKIFKKSAEKGNPIINPITTRDQLKALAKILRSSTLEREGCCYKLSGELKCFLAFLLLQRPTRRKRSCGCMIKTGISGRSASPVFAAETNFHARYDKIRQHINLSRFQLPVSLYGFQPPPLPNLP